MAQIWSWFRLDQKTKHECSLPTPDPFLSLEMNPIKKFILKLVILSEYHPLHKQFFRSTGVIAFEKRRQIQARLWYIIHPFSILSMIWQVIFGIVVTLQMINLPLAHATTFDFPFGPYFHVLDWLCFLNLLVVFVSGYVDKPTMEVVLNHRLIIRKYVRGYFIIDLTGSLPLISVAFFLINFKYFSTVKIRWLVLDFFHLVLIRFFILYSETILSFFKPSEYSRDAFGIISLFLIVCHTLSCFISYIVFFIHGSDIVNQNESWVKSVSSTGDFTPLSYIVPQLAPGSDDENLIYEEYSEKDPFRYYIMCACRTISLLYCLGFGSTAPQTPEDIYISILYIILGKFLIFYALAKLLKYRSWVKSPTVKYHMLMKQVNEYMRRKQLPPTLQRKVRLFYEYRFDKRFFEERAILALLSQNLRDEIRVQECRRLVMESILFRDAPIQVVEKILTRLKQDVYLPNDVLFKAGQLGDCMYFLVSGTVAVLSRAGDEMLHLKDGAFFGELALLAADERRTATIVAVEVCEVYRLSKEDFMRVMRPMQELYGHIQDVAEKRLSELEGIESMYRSFHASQSMVSGSRGASAGAGTSVQRTSDHSQD